MIVNKSMFPLQTGFSVISKMQDKFATLQMQLGTGVKAQTLAEMGRDLPVSLSVRSRLSTIEGYNANIEQVNLRLSFYDSALSRMDKIEGEARNSAVQGQYGTNNINMATIPGLSKAKLDEMVTMLNADVAGRYLFGGSKTDVPPLPSSAELMNGAGGRVGFQTVVSERQAADAGEDGRGRLLVEQSGGVISLTEDGVHPFGFKLAAMSDIGSGVHVTQPEPGATPRGDKISITLSPTIKAGESVTLGLTLPDGTQTGITLRAVDATATPGPGEFRVVPNDASATATSLSSALIGKLESVGKSELAAASTFEAAENFFNAAGEPVLRIEGDNPYTADKLRVATPLDTVMWYRGETASVSASNMARLSTSVSGASVTLTGAAPASADHGFTVSGLSFSRTATAAATAIAAAGDPAAATIEFDGTEEPGAKVKVTLGGPGNTTRDVWLEGVSGTAGPGQFKLGATPEATAANFERALKTSITVAAAQAEGNPRQSVSSAIQDAGRVDYGMQANEAGYLRLVRSFASMSVETYPELSSAAASQDPGAVDLDPAKKRFDAMATRQQSQLSEARNAERGSIETITMDIGIARSANQAATQRHTNYKAQLENLLSDVESIDKESVAMEILALQTRLTASYQVTSMVSQLSLVNFLR